MKPSLNMVSAALLSILTLTVTRISATSDTSWNLATSPTPEVPTANNISESRYPRCVISNEWVTPNFQPSDCVEALKKLRNLRVLTEGFTTFEFKYAGGTNQTQSPSFVLPEVFAYRKSPRGLMCLRHTPSNLYCTPESCTIQVLITRYYTGRRIRYQNTYPRTELATYFRIYNAAFAIYRGCVQIPPLPDLPRSTGYFLLGMI